MLDTEECLTIPSRVLIKRNSKLLAENLELKNSNKFLNRLVGDYLIEIKELKDKLDKLGEKYD